MTLLAPTTPSPPPKNNNVVDVLSALNGFALLWYDRITGRTETPMATVTPSNLPASDRSDSKLQSAVPAIIAIAGIGFLIFAIARSR